MPDTHGPEPGTSAEAAAPGPESESHLANKQRTPLFLMEPGKPREALRIRSSFHGAPPIWFSSIFLLMGLAVIGVLGTSTFGGRRSMPEFLAGLLVMMLFGGVFTGIGLTLLVLRRRMHGMVCANTLAEEFGLDGQELADVAESERIAPTLYLNDEPMYRREDFERAVLLRPTTAAVSTESTLLRVPSATDQQDERFLLRADTDPPAPVVLGASEEARHETLRLKQSSGDR